MKTTLLHEVNEPDGAEKTFSKVIELINSAKSSIMIHMYVWRSDNIGNAIGDALCNAAADKAPTSVFPAGKGPSPASA